MSGAIAMVRAAVMHSRGKHDDGLQQETNRLADGVSTDRLSRTELQLLPVLASSFIDLVPDHPATPIAEGAKRRAAAEALLSQSAATSAASALADHGLTVAPLKGLALSGTYESLNWRRPMGDADLLILEQASWADVDAALTSHDFRRAPGSHHARNYDLPDGRRVDVHRFVSTPNAFPRALRQAIPALVERLSVAVPFRQLAAEFHMAHAIEHAMRWNPIPPARSISDIAAIQESTPNLDWLIVHRLLTEWCAAINGRALVTVLVEAEILPTRAIDRQPLHTSPSDRWIQRLAPRDPRTSWVGQSATYFGLIPWRLWRNVEGFSYREYLRSLWSLHEGQSLAHAAGTRVSRRLRYGRNLPQYIHE